MYKRQIVHCVLILQGVMSGGFRPTLPLTGGSDPGVMSGGLCPPIDYGSELSAQKHRLYIKRCWSTFLPTNDRIKSSVNGSISQSYLSTDDRRRIRINFDAQI